MATIAVNESLAPIVSLTDFAAIVELLVKAKAANPENIVTPIIWGMHGVGKTSSIKQLARKMGYNFVVLHPAHWRLEDLIGLPKAVEIRSEDGKSVVGHETVYSRPTWLHAILKDPRPAILFVDEFNRARDQDVFQAMIPFLLEHHLGPHEIRPSDLIIAAANPECGDYNVTELGDAALLSRFAHFTLQPSVSEWSLWNRQQGNVHLACIEVMESAADALCPKTKVPDGSRVKVYPDRRNVTRYGMLMHAAKEGNFYDKGSLIHLGNAMLGGAATTTILLKQEEIEARERNLTVKNIVDGTALNVLKDMKEFEKLVVLNNQLAAELASGDIKLNAKSRKNVEAWLHAINIEHLYAFYQGLKQAYTSRNGNDVKAGNHLAYEEIVKPMTGTYDDEGRPVKEGGKTIVQKILQHQNKEKDASAGLNAAKKGSGKSDGGNNAEGA